MSTFGKRFGYYGFGVALGIGVVFFMFGSRSDIRCNYFPTARVLGSLSQKEVKLSPLAQCQYECLQLDSNDLRVFFLAGNIQFKQSEPRKKPHGEYQIFTRTPGMKELTARVENQDSVVVFLSIESKSSACGCE